MSTHRVDTRDPGILNWRRYSRNGMLASAPMEHKIRNAHNHALRFRRKGFSKGSALAALGNIGGTYAYQFCVRTGHGVNEIRAVIGVLPSTSNEPYAYAEAQDVFDTSTVTTGTKVRTFTVGTNQDYPDNMYFGESVITGLSPDTVYVVRIRESGNARIFAAMVYERGDAPVDTADGALDPRFGRDSQILDANVSAMHSQLDAMWTTNGAMICAWSPDDTDSSPATISSATWTNPFDLSSTSVSSTTPGCTLPDFDKRASVNDSNVNLEIAAVGAITSGGGTGEVRFGDGTNWITITGITGSSWSKTTGSLPATDGLKADVMFRASNGSTTFRLDGFCAWLLD